MALKVIAGVTITIVPVPPGATKILPVPIAQQQQTNWCWAGCCQMVLAYRGRNVQQCDMASFQFGANCCAAPSSSTCNQGTWPEPIYRHWGINCLRSNGAFSLSQIQSCINGDSPVEPSYAWSGGGVHLAVIIGYYDNGDLSVNDPWYGPSRRSYSNVLSAYGLGLWTITFDNL
jgi:hypothetical protein